MEIGRALKRIEMAFRKDGDRMLEKYGLTASGIYKSIKEWI